MPNADFVIKGDNDKICIEIPYNKKYINLAHEILNLFGEDGAPKVKAKDKKIKDAAVVNFKKKVRLHDESLMNHIQSVFDSKKSEDEIVAKFYETYPDVEVNDHRLRRFVRKMLREAI